ncbi:glycoside hydrolase family 31 protein, partial [bacterium]|nr:glycoside hydrolase family 31 protein [bacterium]
SNPEVNATPTDTEKAWSIATEKISFEMDKQKNTFSIFDKKNNKTLLTQSEMQFTDNFSQISFSAKSDEDWVGFGDQTRERLYHRGHSANLWVSNVKSYVPVPFFMSTDGYGILINSTHHVVCDMCHSEEDTFFWQDKRGDIDFYVFAGDNFKNIINQYCDLTGKPKLPPVWSFGTWFICRMQANDFELMDNAVKFRERGIPCDVIGLEPTWMEKWYDYSTEKKWNDKDFNLPYWAPNGPHNFFNALYRMGYKFELWLCMDYDLSYEAERRIKGKVDAIKAVDEGGAFHEGAEMDLHFSAPTYMDKITKPEEPWFEHLKKFVDQGISFFKQDGSLQVNDHPDRLYGNGMNDAEMHNLYPLLYSQQMILGFEEYTGKRAVAFTDAGWTGFQAWCGTWTGDTGGGLGTLGGMLNTSLVGHSWSTNDMEATQKEGIHFGYLQPWSQINSWTYWRMPWVQGAEMETMHTYYARLRSRLIPYIYSWAFQATQSAIPLMLPLTLEFEKDPACREILHEYLLGRDLLVTIFKEETYLPTGRWKNFWTGEIYEGNQSYTISWPQNRGGGLFVREGAIIPMGPVMQYRGEKPLDDIELYLFPGEMKTTFEFYEDDGVTLKHQDGEHLITPITLEKSRTAVQIQIGTPKGRFDNGIKTRCWKLTLALDSKPLTVTVDNDIVLGWHWDQGRNEVEITEICDNSTIEIQ